MSIFADLSSFIRKRMTVKYIVCCVSCIYERHVPVLKGSWHNVACLYWKCR